MIFQRSPDLWSFDALIAGRPHLDFTALAPEEPVRYYPMLGRQLAGCHVCLNRTRNTRKGWDQARTITASDKRLQVRHRIHILSS
jgi:hypothetical protein